VKQETCFRCEICGQVFLKESECHNHENNHILPVEIHKSSYEEWSNYPAEISITFSDHSKAWYVQMDAEHKKQQYHKGKRL